MGTSAKRCNRVGQTRVDRAFVRPGGRLETRHRNLPGRLSEVARVRGGDRRRPTGVLALGLLLLAVVWATGCSMPKRSFQPERDPATLDDTSFLHYLATVPVVTVDEGMRAVLALTADGQPTTTFEQRFDLLRRRGAVKAGWRLAPDQILDKGTLAYMLKIVCDLPRGLNDVLSSVTGVGDRRCALKICIHEGLMPYAGPYEVVAGGELLAALTRAEGYLESKRPDVP